MATRKVLRYTGTAISCAALFSLSAYLRPTCRSLKRTGDLTIETKHDAPESFRDIHLVRELVNPRNYTETHDSRSVTLTLPASPHQSDELLLSSLVKGFFGGWVFTPEGKALSFARPADCKYTKLQGTTVPAHIWNASEISDESLPPLHTVYFGQFRLANIQVADGGSAHSDEALIENMHGEEKESYVDFVYGSDLDTFAGCHRLSVQRVPLEDGESPQKAVFTLSCMACDPQVDHEIKPQAIITFHRIYATMLFRDAVGNVIDKLKELPQV